MRALHWATMLAWGLWAPSAAVAQPIPTCRLDGKAAALVADTVKAAAQSYREAGRTLPFETVVLNQAPPAGGRALVVNVISDASADAVRSDGCATRPLAQGDQLDKLSVRGGCFVAGDAKLEIRCSARAVELFGRVGDRPGRANPALLYVLAHELGHIHQRQVGEYEGRAVGIDLAQPRAQKLEAIRESCAPAATKREEEADAFALDVLKRLLPKPPYREPAFSERGSALWGVDQLVLAANAWQKASLELEFVSRPPVHKAFVATEFPTPPAKVNAAARAFVCDVLGGKSGSLFHPLQSATHPSLDERMGRVAGAIRPVATGLPNDTSKTVFESVAHLQSQVSPILSHIYRENGEYMGKIHATICTIANSPSEPSCRK